MKNQNRRYTIEKTATMKFYQMPKVFFTNESYKKISNNAKVMYMLMSDRLQLSIKNSWTNDKGEVYFVYPVEKLMEMTGLSKPTAIKSKKELMSVGLLEEERTGRANKMFLLQPVATQDDFYLMAKQEYDIDLDSDKTKRGEDGRFSRSKDSLLLDDNKDLTRSKDSLLLEETLAEVHSDQKLNNFTSEVKNFYPNDTELKETEEEDKYNTKDSEITIDQNQKDIVDYFISSGLDPEVIMSIIDKILGTYLMNLDLIKQQMEWCEKKGKKDGIANFPSYFVNGLEMRADAFGVRAKKEKESELPKVTLHNWLKD